MKNKTVWVENAEADYQQMFRSNGWEVKTTPAEADFLQFTGGHDVSPHYYGQKEHKTTFSNSARDKRCFELFSFAQKERKACLGICRGAQFLTVASGGSLWQNVEKHTVGHLIVDLLYAKTVPVSSTHHQMMCSDNIPDRVLLAVSGEHYRTRKQKEDDEYHYSPYDEEANFYPTSQSLAYQPHPEFFGKDHPCQAYYFSLIARCFGV